MVTAGNPVADDLAAAMAYDDKELKAQIGELHNLNKQITEEAASLARALRGEKKTQGNWEIKVWRSR